MKKGWQEQDPDTGPRWNNTWINNLIKILFE